MAKEAPALTVNMDDSSGASKDISNDVTGVGISTPRAVQDVTGVDKVAIERLLLMADLSVTLDGVFDDAANLSHAVFKTVPSTSVARTHTLVMSGQTLTAQEVFLTDYVLTRSIDGSLVWNVPVVLQNGTAPSWS
jgi:hypothetical protein